MWAMLVLGVVGGCEGCVGHLGGVGPWNFSVAQSKMM